MQIWLHFFLLPNIQTLIFTWDVVNTMINRHYMWNYSKYNEKKRRNEGRYLENMNMNIPPEKEIC